MLVVCTERGAKPEGLVLVTVIVTPASPVVVPSLVTRPLILYSLRTKLAAV